MSESEPDDFLKAFERTSEEREEAFEQSTLKLILQQLGYPPKKVRSLSYEYGPAFGFDWFNEQDLIPIHIVTGRCFSFNFREIYTKPNKSPVTQLFIEKLDEEKDRISDSEKTFCLVFKCYEIGRLAALGYPMHADITASITHLHVAARHVAFSIVPMSGFFSERYGNLFQEQQ